MPEPVRPSRVRGALPAVAGISLANKSQLLFGLAAAVILSLALAVPWVRGGLLIRAFEAEEARRIAAAWLDGRVSIAEADVRTGPFEPRVNAADRVVDVTVVPLIAAAEPAATSDPGATPAAADPPESEKGKVSFAAGRTTCLAVCTNGYSIQSRGSTKGSTVCCLGGMLMTIDGDTRWPRESMRRP